MIKHNGKCTYQNEFHYWEIINIEEEKAEIKCYFCNEKREVEIPKVNIDLSKLSQNELLDMYDFQHAIITFEFKKESEEKLKKEISFLREIKDFLRKLRVHNENKRFQDFKEKFPEHFESDFEEDELSDFS